MAPMVFNIELAIDFSLMRSLLPTAKKLKACREVLEEGRSLIAVAKKYGCCRQSLYFWIKKFQKNPHRAAQILKSNFRRGGKHPRRVRWLVEKRILNLVIANPQNSSKKLQQELVAQGVKISAHGVHIVLSRNNLTREEARRRFSELAPVATTLATAFPPAYRAKIVEEYLKEGKPVAQICKFWHISKPTFYEWLRRYQEVTGGIEEGIEGQRVAALARRYKKGDEHHLAVGARIKQIVLDMVRQDPALSKHKIAAAVPAVAGRPVVSHHGIQNILTREGLSTLARRLAWATGFVRPEAIKVAPLYRPEIPVYRLRMILSPFASIPKLLVTNPGAGLLRLVALLVPLSIFALWIRMLAAGGVSPVGLVFASIALFFGLFFFIYSLKYYVSILLILRLAQSGAVGKGEPPFAGASEDKPSFVRQSRTSEDKQEGS